MNASRHLIQGRLGFEIFLDELNGFLNPLKILGLLRIIVGIHFKPLSFLTLRYDNELLH